MFSHGVDGLEMIIVGSKSCPHTTAGPTFEGEGVPYGSFCRCSRCGLVARSTMLFDYYNRPDGTLWCESCTTGVANYSAVANQLAEKVIKEFNEKGST